ncbi:hypothetical protein PFICI_07754 [Pestalotiopsis fici W106-1]|uniref:Uncharacterized protein n=1 Tax=Pestalotiopsis fici (strain W106-1 / CGMCC3.15140) TaxID=1229662 RepID=W3X2D6_PESFW|nr:uncharacterized protein PFICI_07754 [Pestalotiopsis fici W106-1]ETS80225.1 hypothetical protein PFICI_07754 [Pestalotiopsis fici W106-1]
MASNNPPPLQRPAAARPVRTMMPATHNNPAVSAPANNVRRNLFQSQLTRRPTPVSSSNSAETLRLDVDVLSDTSEIVVRDKNGDFKLDDPPTPPMEDASEEGAIDEDRENERMTEPHSKRSNAGIRGGIG